MGWAYTMGSKSSRDKLTKGKLCPDTVGKNKMPAYANIPNEVQIKNVSSILNIPTRTPMRQSDCQWLHTRRGGCCLGCRPARCGCHASASRREHSLWPKCLDICGIYLVNYRNLTNFIIFHLLTVSCFKLEKLYYSCTTTILLYCIWQGSNSYIIN